MPIGFERVLFENALCCRLKIVELVQISAHSTGPIESTEAQSDTDAERHLTEPTDSLRPLLTEVAPMDLLLCDILDKADGHSLQ